MHVKGRFVDFHVHSTHSCDGRSSIFELCRRALKLGMTEIGFSEHVDFDPVDRGFRFFNYERYTSEIKRAQESFKKRLTIRKGVEIDYQRCYEEQIAEWLRDKRFDFIIGSVHYINHEIVSHQLVASKDLREIYSIYFNEVNCSIRSNLFDVIGHLDLVRGYTESSMLELERIGYREHIQRTLQEIIEKKTYLEINSKGLREARGDTIPNKETIEKYIENRGELISVESDAHSAQELSSGVQEILDFLTHRESHLRLLFE